MSMTVEQFNDVMKRCKANTQIRWVQPTIHPGSGRIYEIAFTVMGDVDVKLVSDHEVSLYERVIKLMNALSNLNKEKQDSFILNVFTDLEESYGSNTGYSKDFGAFLQFYDS